MPKKLGADFSTLSEDFSINVLKTRPSCCCLLRVYFEPARLSCALEILMTLYLALNVTKLLMGEIYECW